MMINDSESFCPKGFTVVSFPHSPIHSHSYTEDSSEDYVVLVILPAAVDTVDHNTLISCFLFKHPIVNKLGLISYFNTDHI